MNAPAPAVRCLGCAFEWHSPALVDGLRLIGSCPKCGGELRFAGTETTEPPASVPSPDPRAPHRVLGLPRR